MKKDLFRLQIADTLSCLKSFSLIELLISLIIISLLLAAFSPLITKKIKASDTTVGNFGADSNTRGVTKEDCDKLNAVFVPAGNGITKPLCVMKYNIGDGYYHETWQGVQRCVAGQPCTVQGGGGGVVPTKEELQPTCWQGTTAANGCNSAFGNYSGCTRTVCNWTGANKMCSNIGWRLPTLDELRAFTDEKYSSKSLESNGLMLCDFSGSSTTAPICHPRANSCPGTYSGHCHPADVWSSSFSTPTKAWDIPLNEVWFEYNYPLTYDFSARCVLDTLDKSKEEKCNCPNGKCSDNGSYCTSCDEGYMLYNNKCIQGTQTQCYDYFCAICKDGNNGSCSACKNGYVLHDGKCYFGSLDGCNGIKYDDTYQRINCTSCQRGYTKCGSGSCRKTSEVEAGVCPKNTLKIGCTCVMQYNIGDGYYGEDLSKVKVCTPGQACDVKNAKNAEATAHDVEPACWDGKKGNTAPLNGCNNNFGGYSGCNRTLCNWTGANKLCNSLGWRLPTYPELQTFTSTTYSSDTLSENGLMLCDHSNRSTTAPICPYLKGGCSGAYNGHCYSHDVWSSSFSTPTIARLRYLDRVWYDHRDYLSHALSVRCVKDL